MRRFKAVFLGGLAAACGTGAFGAPEARASFQTALSAPVLFPKAPGPGTGLGAEKTIRMNQVIELGGGFDRMFLSYADGDIGQLRVFNLVQHLRIPGLGGLRLDGRIGVTQRTEIQSFSGNEILSGLAPTAGVGLSYPIAIGKHAILTPRVGMRYIRNALSPVDLGPSGLFAEAAILFVFTF